MKKVKNPTGKGGFAKGTSGNMLGAPPPEERLRTIVNAHLDTPAQSVIIPPPGEPQASLTAAMKEHLCHVPVDQRMTRKQQLIEKVFDMAIRGDMGATKLIWNYMDGMPKQHIDHTTGGKDLFGRETAITVLKEYEQEGSGDSEFSE